ncbi:MAG: hypothetical protein Q7T21_02920, partial [Gallionella sp.]|nr:hypothetical protein [Gallionella sp.]
MASNQQFHAFLFHNCCTATILQRPFMFSNSPFESIAKTMKENAEKLNPDASQEAFKPFLEQIMALGDLALKHAQVSQAAVAETVESFKSIKEPQAAFDAMKASAENGLAMATKNLKDVTALG